MLVPFRKKARLFFIFSSIVLSLGISLGWSATIYWDGEAGDSLWETPENWSRDALPVADDDVFILAPQEDVLVRKSSSDTITFSSVRINSQDNAGYEKTVRFQITSSGSLRSEEILIGQSGPVYFESYGQVIGDRMRVGGDVALVKVETRNYVSINGDLTLEGDKEVQFRSLGNTRVKGALRIGTNTPVSGKHRYSQEFSGATRLGSLTVLPSGELSIKASDQYGGIFYDGYVVNVQGKMSISRGRFFSLHHLSLYLGSPYRDLPALLYHYAESSMTSLYVGTNGTYGKYVFNGGTFRGYPDLWMGSDGGYGEWEHNRGRLRFSQLKIAPGNDGEGKYVLNSGVVTVSSTVSWSNFVVGGVGKGEFVVNGGQVLIGTPLVIAQTSSSEGRFVINGGYAELTRSVPVLVGDMGNGYMGIFRGEANFSRGSDVYLGYRGNSVGKLELVGGVLRAYRVRVKNAADEDKDGGLIVKGGRLNVAERLTLDSENAYGEISSGQVSTPLVVMTAGQLSISGGDVEVEHMKEYGGVIELGEGANPLILQGEFSSDVMMKGGSFRAQWAFFRSGSRLEGWGKIEANDNNSSLVFFPGSEIKVGAEDNFGSLQIVFPGIHFRGDIFFNLGSEDYDFIDLLNGHLFQLWDTSRLWVSLTDGFSLSLPEYDFHLIRSNIALTGEFGEMFLPDVDGYSWQTLYADDGFHLIARRNSAVVPEPATGYLLLLGLGMLGGFYRRQSRFT